MECVSFAAGGGGVVCIISGLLWFVVSYNDGCCHCVATSVSSDLLMRSWQLGDKFMALKGMIRVGIVAHILEAARANRQAPWKHVSDPLTAITS